MASPEEPEIVAILRAFPDAVFVLSGGGALFPKNDKARELLQFRIELTGLWSDWRSLAEQVSEHGLRLEHLEAHRDDQCRTMELRLSPLGEDSVLVVAREVSAEIRRNQLRAEYVDRIAHDLRTPLTTAMLTIDLIASSESMTSDACEGLAVVREQLGREQQIVEELLEATRLESGKIDLNPAAMDLQPVLGQVIMKTRVAAQAQGTRFSSEVPAELPKVNGDYAAVQRALEDLLGNALESTSAEDSIRLTVDVDHAGVRVEITDDGRPIKKEELPFFFDLFHVTASNHSGSRSGGVELFRAKVVAAKLGGWLSIDSNGRNGAVVTLSLPLTGERNAAN